MIQTADERCRVCVFKKDINVALGTSSAVKKKMCRELKTSKHIHTYSILINMCILIDIQDGKIDGEGRLVGLSRPHLHHD